MIRITTADEAKAQIVTAIEAGGAATSDEYDIDAIFRETYTWKIDTDDDGYELLNTGGFEKTGADEEFWAVVAKHEIIPGEVTS